VAREVSEQPGESLVEFIAANRHVQLVEGVLERIVGVERVHRLQEQLEPEPSEKKKIVHRLQEQLDP